MILIMKLIVIFILIILFPFQKAKADAVTRAAFSYSQRAFFSYPENRAMKRKAEKYAYSFLPFKKERVVLIGGLGFAIYSGNISTKNFKNLSVGFLGWNMSPELSLNTRTGQMFALISLDKQF